MRSEIDDWLRSSPGPASERNGSTRTIGADPGPNPSPGEVVNRPPSFSGISDNVAEFQLVFRKNMDNFIRVEVETGCTFAFVARDASDAAKRAKNFTAAHKAYRTAYRFFAKYGVSSPDLRSEIVDRLDDLRALLDREGLTKDWCALLEIVEHGASRASGSATGPSSL